MGTQHIYIRLKVRPEIIFTKCGNTKLAKSNCLEKPATNQSIHKEIKIIFRGLLLSDSPFILPSAIYQGLKYTLPGDLHRYENLLSP
jgi:hypothetical protein